MSSECRSVGWSEPAREDWSRCWTRSGTVPADCHPRRRLLL